DYHLILLPLLSHLSYPLLLVSNRALHHRLLINYVALDSLYQALLLPIYIPLLRQQAQVLYLYYRLSVQQFYLHTLLHLLYLSLFKYSNFNKISVLYYSASVFNLTIWVSPIRSVILFATLIFKASNSY